MEEQERKRMQSIKEELRTLNEQQRELQNALEQLGQSEGRSEVIEAIVIWLQNFPEAERKEELETLLWDDVMCRECGPGTLRTIYYDATVIADMQGKLLDLFEYGEADYSCLEDRNHVILHLSQYNITTEDVLP